ncbi:hypothetical protein GCK72_010457 [Caenorhabditis remanei]|uniref:Ubiquitin-related modifier 1 homolog n=3 Tax=Caenorhabditis remanei TaxID=31234 RepID=A0A6A5H566_CAERE|nr:hypothetical protein GCK72_010457 [Caenorhabditis remanei]KAF1762195.1 hypothetical protein GCK72_010457 [Caenorhabditis remanei]
MHHVIPQLLPLVHQQTTTNCMRSGDFYQRNSLTFARPPTANARGSLTALPVACAIMFLTAGLLNLDLIINLILLCCNDTLRAILTPDLEKVPLAVYLHDPILLHCCSCVEFQETCSFIFDSVLVITAIAIAETSKQRTRHEQRFSAVSKLLYVSIKQMSSTIPVTIDFSGGAEFLVKAKVQKVQIPEESTLRDVLKFVRDNLVTDVHRINMLLNDDASEVAHGVITLINDTDTGLLSEYDTVIEAGDTITFVSTLHGG